MLEMDPKFCVVPGMTPEQEFEEMRAHSALDDHVTAEADGARSQHTKSSLAAVSVKPFITFQSMCLWYRRALDNTLYPSSCVATAKPVNANLHAEFESGIIVDIDEFQDLLLNCHYKTRTRLPSIAAETTAKIQRASSTSQLVKHQQTPV